MPDTSNPAKIRWALKAQTSGMRPSREQSLSEYFKHESEKIWLNRPDVTNATYTCVCFFANAVNTEDVVAAFDDGGTQIDIPVWYEEQKATVDYWQTVEGLKNAIMSRIDDCGLEEYEGLWSIGEGSQFEYSTDEAFLAEVDWDYLLGITKNCWALVSVRESKSAI